MDGAAAATPAAGFPGHIRSRYKRAEDDQWPWSNAGKETVMKPILPIQNITPAELDDAIKKAVKIAGDRTQSAGAGTLAVRGLCEV
jgi:hypothetical protein